MKFCPTCGILLLPKKAGGRTVLQCSSCGYTVKAANIEDYKIVKKSEKADEIPVLEEEAPSTLPVAKAKCPKCGHNKAQWWIRQTRSADEPSTRFYRCEKCGKVWREYA